MTPRDLSFSYDEYLCRKPPALMIIALFYLSRAVTLPLVVGVLTYTGMSTDTTSLMQGLFDLHTVPPSLIAATVLFALARRKPAASRPVRWIWAHGRALLALSAILDIVLSVMSSPLVHGDLNDRAGMTLLAVAFDLYFLTYILAARVVRTVFADFPAAPAGPATS